MKALFLSLLISLPVAAQQVTYRVGEQNYQGCFAKAQGPSKGSILLIHDWDGLT
jgi:hypothetical protein